MKSFAVVLVVTISLCGFFTQLANGLSCYQCSWTDTSCATEKIDSKLKKIDCATVPAPGGAPTPAPGEAPTPEPAGAPTTAPPPSKLGPEPAMFKNNKLFHGMADPTYYCFKVNVKANSSATPAVERGCKTTNKADDCVVIDKAAHATAVAESCTVCSKDNCNGNGQSMVTGSVVQCALISSLVVAKMFFQTK
uniref:Protein sleepless n=1 Tax=Schizaphis graminum TaxID=13262 RepID=A0A2S2PDT4_SCHGA